MGGPTELVQRQSVSYHAIAQYHVAACQHYGGPPPALRCISPWEGFADTYREIACPGGLDDRGFGPFWWMMEVKPALNGLTADFLKFNECLPSDYIQLHPFYDDFWREMTAKLEQINIPMLVCASFSDHGLHTAGSFRAFVKARSRHKWVYTHRTGKWDAYYSPEVQQLTKEFMDCFLKDDTASGFLTRPPVRLEVRSNRDVIHEIRHEEAWPLTRTEYTKFFLSIIPRKLDLEKNPTSQAIAYSAKRGRASFRIRLDKDTELTGHMKLRLWVQAKATPGSSLPPPDDMAIFVAVNKRDRQGRAVPFFGSVGNRADMVTRGFCRVSRRELDFNESTNYEPVITGTAHEPLEPNQIVPVDIALYPSSTFFAAGETLELIISSNEIIPSPPYIKDVRFNRGKHVIFCGGDYDSYLLVPNIPVPSPDAGRPEKP
jgi:putative CocE/NonD family hydrolase